MHIDAPGGKIEKLAPLPSPAACIQKVRARSSSPSSTPADLSAALQATHKLFYPRSYPINVVLS
jgi:hypothetical protein